MVEPTLGIDGWTFQGTALEGALPGGVEAEAAALVHAVCGGAALATRWTYEQAARLLEEAGEVSQAYAVLEAGVGSGVLAATDGGLARWRGRLAGKVLGGAGPAAE